jgi:ketosteroid isomerase-like protein
MEVWNRGDYDEWTALIGQLAHPELEWYPVIAQLVEGPETVYRGLDGMGQFWSDWHEIFDFQFEDAEIRDLGDTLVVLSQVSVKGRGSGVGLETPLAMVVRFEEGRLRRLDSYLDPAEALRAAGVPDE